MIIIAGCGALGSLASLHLAYLAGYDFFLIDDDRVGEENIATSAYSYRHIGRKKSIVLQDLLFNAGRIDAYAYVSRFTNKNYCDIIPARYDIDLALVTFDNLESRALFRDAGFPVVQAGLTADRTGLVCTTHDFPFGDMVDPAGTNPICTHELGVRIIRRTALAAAEAVEHYLEHGTIPMTVVTEKEFIHNV